MTVEKMRLLRELLNERFDDYESKLDELKRSILENPTDRNIEKCFVLVHDYELQSTYAYKASLSLKFDIEKITGEEEK